jgi:hypothetical protein
LPSGLLEEENQGEDDGSVEVTLGEEVEPADRPHRFAFLHGVAVRVDLDTRETCSSIRLGTDTVEVMQCFVLETVSTTEGG